MDKQKASPSRKATHNLIIPDILWNRIEHVSTRSFAIGANYSMSAIVRQALTDFLPQLEAKLDITRD